MCMGFNSTTSKTAIETTHYHATIITFTTYKYQVSGYTTTTCKNNICIFSPGVTSYIVRSGLDRQNFQISLNYGKLGRVFGPETSFECLNDN